jgi:hypothetical protein
MAAVAVSRATGVKPSMTVRQAGRYAAGRMSMRILRIGRRVRLLIASTPLFVRGFYSACIKGGRVRDTLVTPFEHTPNLVAKALLAALQPGSPSLAISRW